MKKTKLEQIKQLGRLIGYILATMWRVIKNKNTWIAVILIVTFYVWGWFNANYYTQSPVKEWQNVIVPRYTRAKQVSFSPKKVLAEIKPIPVPPKAIATIEKHKKYLTTQQYENQQYARKYFEAFYNVDEVQAMDNVILSEGWYQVDIKNPETGACGIGQAYPCEKMGCPLDQSGLDCQLEWTMKYVNGRYGNPIKAWAFRQANGWY